ncbi:hypothetical protein [Blastococcus sp. SYSU D00813]
MLLGGAALVGIAVGAYVLVDRPVETSSDAASAPPAAAGTPSSPTAAGETDGAVPDPRASEAPLPPSVPPVEEVATDDPVAAPDGPADVVLSYADWDAASASVHVNAFLGGLLEDGGTCTLTLTQGGESRTASASGVADVSTTICGLLEVPGSGLAPGAWSAVVTYDSPTTRGASDAVEVTVP